MMVGIWDCLFLGAMLNFRGVTPEKDGWENWKTVFLSEGKFSRELGELRDGILSNH